MHTLIEQICKCHGHPIDLATNKEKWVCPITSRQLAASDVTATAVRIGEQTVLFLPTSEGGSNTRRASNSVSLNVIERTELASLDEGTQRIKYMHLILYGICFMSFNLMTLSTGVIMGTPHIVIPSPNDVDVALTDEGSDQNTQS